MKRRPGPFAYREQPAAAVAENAQFEQLVSPRDSSRERIGS